MILGAGVLAFVANLAVLSGGETPGLQAAASRTDLAPGRRLQLDDLRLTPVDVEQSIASGLLSESELADHQGWVITRPLRAGALIHKTDLQAPPAQPTWRAMSLPIDPEHAVGGDLVLGDLVDVIRVDGDRAWFVATGLQVLDVAEPSGGSLGLSGGFHLVVGVSERTALALALALARGQVEVLRATGSGPVTVGSLKDYRNDPRDLGPAPGEADDPAWRGARSAEADPPAGAPPLP